mmetsp:Transcript_78240/g.114581  ORF Transcript_78240/g.114581 Transcript_78240/m.114581 type:complete len:273 (+) Transcript_78240:51-869(+)
MAPPKYKDLGKKANDILNEDFKFEQTFELKSQVNGVEVKSIFSDKGKGMTGNMECKKGVSSVGDVTIKTDHAFENPSLMIENTSMMKGLKLKAEMPCLPDKLKKNGVVISPEFKHDSVMFTAKAESGKQCVVIDASFAAGPANVGLQTKATANGKVSGTSAALEYTAGSMILAGKYELDKGAFAGSMHTSVNDQTDVAVAFSSGGDLTLGANYKIDGDSNVKGKVDKKGVISLFYIQKVRKDLTLKVSAAIDSGNLSGSNAHKWGLQAVMSM